MHGVSILAIAALLGQQVSAHYFWSHFIMNGKATESFKYVRNVETHHAGQSSLGQDYPLQGKDIMSTNFTCGRMAFELSGKTETADVYAGDEIGFKLRDNQRIFHVGPAQIYMSKVPDGKKISEYSGYEEDAQWFKVASWGVYDDTHWWTSDWKELNFTIPLTTPPGEYLVRVETVWAYDESWIDLIQWYLACAQVNVIGGGGGQPTDFIKFPGGYAIDDPGFIITRNQSNKGVDLLKYPGPPGPPVWRG